MSSAVKRSISCQLFTHATQRVSAVFAVAMCLSGYLSRSGIVSKRLNLS